MDTKNILLSLFLMSMLVLGMGSCNNDSIPRQVETKKTNNPLSTLRGISGGIGWINISSSYEDKSSKFYRGLTPDDCHFEIFRVSRKGSTDESLKNYVKTFDSKNDDYVFTSYNIERYKTLSVTEKSFGEYYSINKTDEVSDIIYKGYKYELKSSDPNLDVDSEPSYYYATIVCPKNKYKITGVTINGESIDKQKIDTLSFDRYVGYNTVNSKYDRSNSEYSDKIVFGVKIPASNDKVNISFVMGNPKYKDFPTYLGPSCLFSCLVHGEGGIIKFLVKNDTISLSANKNPSGDFVSKRYSYYFPINTKIKFIGVENDYNGGISWCFSKMLSNSVECEGSEMDFSSDSTFILEKTVNNYEFFFNPILKFKVGKHNNCDVRFSYGNKVYVNEDFCYMFPRERDSLKLKIEVINKDPNKYEFKCLKIKDRNGNIIKTIRDSNSLNFDVEELLNKLGIVDPTILPLTFDAESVPLPTRVMWKPYRH